MSHIIKIEHQVNLARLARFYNLKLQMEQERNRYYKLHNSAMVLASEYLDALPEAKTIIRLRREIRLATKGTPQTIAEDTITSAGYVSVGTEQLYNAQSHLVKVAFRMVAPLVHPDRGGDLKLFQQVNAAYRLRDLTFLQELFLFLVKDNVFWRCSDEAEQYLQQEIQRPAVSLQRLRNQPEFQIVMLHRSGKPELATKFATHRAKALIYILQAELNHLLNPNVTEMEQQNGNSNEEAGQEGRDSGNKDWSEGIHKDFRESSDSPGEGSPGTRS